MNKSIFTFLVLSVVANNARADVFRFACTDSATNAQIAIAGTSTSKFHFTGTRYQVSASVQLNGAAALITSDPNQEQGNAYAASLKDSNDQTEINFATGASDLQGAFGFGQLDSAPAKGNGQFAAHASVLKINGQKIETPSVVALTCIGTDQHLQGDGAANFWNSLGDALGNLAGSIFENRN